MSTTSLLAGVVGEYPSGSIPRGMPMSQQKTQRLDDRSNFRESRIFRAGFFVHVELSILPLARAYFSGSKGSEREWPHRDG